MMIFLFLDFLYCTVYFVNSEKSTFKLQQINIKIYCINTEQKLDLPNKLELEQEDIKREIINLYKNDIKKYENISFISLNKYKKKNDKNPHIIIAYKFYQNYKYSRKEDLIVGGCKYKIIKIGPYYFCECSYKKCGMFCEMEKNIALIFACICICLLVLYVKNMENKAEVFYYKSKEKRKEKTS